MCPRVFRWGPHFGEEPPLLEGGNGSGAVFFSRCTMKCIYCQNSPWSWCGQGDDISIAQLTNIFRELAVKDKCANWNLVSPTPYLPFIREAVKPLFDEGVRLPFIYNSSGYENVATLEEYSELCDCALFDLRYASSQTALKASASPNYVAAARHSIQWASGRSPRVDGLPPLIVRILVLPGLADEAIENLAWLATEISCDIPVSIMSQYTPVYKALEVPPFNREVTEEEYTEVTEAAADFGFTNGWIQGFESRNPDLDLLGESMPQGHAAVGKSSTAN